jgi:hypothetical protein
MNHRRTPPTPCTPERPEPPEWSQRPQLPHWPRLATWCTAATAMLVLGACGGGDTSAADDAASVLVYKATASQSCAATATTQNNLNTAVAALRAAGAMVQSATCGNTGNPILAVCGIWNGDVWVVAVSQPTLATALAQGFESASVLPLLKTAACAP